MDAWSLMRGDAFIHFVCGSRRVNIRLGVLLLIPKSPQTRSIYPDKRNKGWSSTFQPPEEGRCDKHGDKKEDNNPKNVNNEQFRDW